MFLPHFFCRSVKMNKIFIGDNLKVLEDVLIEKESIRKARIKLINYINKW